MRLIASAFVVFCGIAASSVALAQEAPVPAEEGPAPKPVRNRPSLFAGGEFEFVASRFFDAYVSARRDAGSENASPYRSNPTSLGARLGVFVPTDRRPATNETPQLAVVASVGVRTAVSGRSWPESTYGTSTENLTVPLEVGLRSIPSPGPVAGYVEGGLRVLLRHVTSTETDGSTTTTTSTKAAWSDPLFGLAAGSGVRVDRVEVGVHATFVMVEPGKASELGIGLRAGYHFFQF